MEKRETKNGYVIAALLLLLLAVIIALNPIQVKGDIAARDDSTSADNEMQASEAPRSSNWPIDESDEIFDVVETEPRFVGGDDAMSKFIQENIKYPKIAIENEDQGKVYVRFVIEKNGEVTHSSIARGVTPEIDMEAIRVIEQMPHWIPGKQRGKSVRTNVVVPITFKLR